MYNIGQVSQMFDIPVSTLRYYDKEDLFTEIPRKSGIRKFSPTDLNRLQIIQCLKKSGLKISQIREYMNLCAQGSRSYQQRKDIFVQQKKAVEEEIKHLKATLDMLNYKCWFYDIAIEDGNEERLQKMMANPELMPPKIQKLYKKTHRKFD